MRGPGWVVWVAGCSALDLSPVAIEPADPTSVQDLVAVPAPPEGEVWTWSWTRDGAPVPEVAGDRVPAALTTRGDVWEVTVVRHDGARDSKPETAEVTVGNTAPTVSVRLTPDPPATDAPLTAVVAAEDADADPIALSYRWTVDGAPSPADGPTLPAGEVRGGQTWEVTVTASDGEAESTAVAAAVAGNTGPRMVLARIEPAVPTDGDVLSVVWEAFDADGDPVDVRISWEVDGVAVSEGDTLASTFFERGDRVQARVEPYDGKVAGATLPTGEVVVANGTPSATGAVVVPAVLSEAVVASCALVGAVDPDGDPVALAVRWYIDGTFVSTAETLTGATFGKGDQVSCEATPSDGSSSGLPVLSGPALVVNTAPVIGTVHLVPEVPTAGGEVVAVPDGISDSDGDEVVTQTRWFVDGVLVGTAPSWSGLVRGQTVQAVMDAYDGDDPALPVQSLQAVVGNALPVVERAAMIPAFPTSGEPVVADVSIVDPDGDPVSFAVAWTVNGVEVAVGEVLPAGVAEEGDLLGYVVTPSDATDAGLPFATPEVVVGNGAPSLAGAEITPDPLDPPDVASCDPVGAVDPDGDPVDLEILWWVNGVDTAVSPTLTGFATGDVVRCSLVPTDGASSGEAVWSEPVTVR